MSKQALYFYAENLPLIQRATFTDSSGKERGIGENGRDLLVFLCNAANEKQNFCFHMGNQYIAQETDIHISTVKRLMAGFEQLGWITRTGRVISHMGRGAPTVEYELSFYTVATENERTSRPTSRPTSRQVATDNLAKVNSHIGTNEKTVTETEPQPETKPQPQAETVDSDLSAGDTRGEWGDEHEALLSACVTWENSNYDGVAGQPLRNKWKAEYKPLVAQVLAMNPRPSDPLGWCYERRKRPQTFDRFTPPRQEAKKAPEIPRCRSCGTVELRIDIDPDGNKVSKWDCDCAERMTA